MRKYSKYIYIISIVVVLGITVGYAAVVSEMSISNIAAEIRTKADIRITDVTLVPDQTNNTVSNDLNYSVDSIVANATFNDSSSYITYKVEVTNIGNVEMGILEITGLHESLSYELTDYALKDKICDSNNNCSSGISKEFYIKIYPTSGTPITHNMKIKFNFQQFHTITYEDITNNGYPTEILNGDNLSITFTGDIPRNVLIYLNNEMVSSSLYSYSNNKLTFNYVTGNLTISGPITFVKMMKRGSVLDSSVNFGSSTGLTTLNNTAYIRKGTENDTNPIYYYRGNVSKNNVYFAGFCWKIVRTTDTGGTKLVYNGALKEEGESSPISQSEYINVTNDATYPYTFDSSTLTWTSTNKTDSSTGEMSFSVASAGDYVLNYTVSSEANYDKAYFYLDGTQLGVYSGTVSGSLNLSELTTSSVIKVQYTKDISDANGSDTVVFSVKQTGNVTTNCDNTGKDSQLDSTSKFNSSYNSPADVGYMYGTRYTYSSKSLSSQSGAYLYGNKVSWDGTNYTLQDTYSSTSWSSDRTTLATKYHYTCFDSDGSCSSVYYIHYFGSSSMAEYLTFTGGITLETAKAAMFTNTTNSIIKTAIDNWYAANMTRYTNKLENTIFCNDRSFYGGTLAGESVSGTSYSYFGAYGRRTSPSVECPNQNDSFTLSVANGGTSGYGNNALQYPVGLLTADEYTLAGSGTSSYSTSSYLHTGQYQWSLSSYGVADDNNTFGFFLYSSGFLYNDYLTTPCGVRPSVSLAPGTEIVGGDGSAQNPYITSYTAPAPDLITFTIAGVTYQAEEGMTLLEWVESSYNTAGYVHIRNIIYESSTSSIGIYASPNEIIENGTRFSVGIII